MKKKKKFSIYFFSTGSCEFINVAQTSKWGDSILNNIQENPEEKTRKTDEGVSDIKNDDLGNTNSSHILKKYLYLKILCNSIAVNYYTNVLNEIESKYFASVLNEGNDKSKDKLEILKILNSKKTVDHLLYNNTEKIYIKNSHRTIDSNTKIKNQTRTVFNEININGASSMKKEPVNKVHHSVLMHRKVAVPVDCLAFLRGHYRMTWRYPDRWALKGSR